MIKRVAHFSLPLSDVAKNAHFYTEAADASGFDVAALVGLSRGATARQAPARRSDGAATLDPTAAHQTGRPTLFAVDGALFGLGRAVVN